MSRSLRSSFSLLSLLAVGCGGAAKPPATAAAPSPSASTATPAPVTASRTPPAELVRYVPFDRTAFTLYADLGGFLHTELGTGIVPAIVGLAGASLTSDQQRCIQGASATVKDALLAAGADDNAVAIIRYDDKAFDLGPCLVAGGAHAIQLAGTTRAFAADDGTIALLPGMAIAGLEPQVKAALGPHPQAVLPREVKLAPDEYLAWSGQFDAQSSAHGALLESNKRFRIALEADVPAPDAEQVEQQFKGIKQNGTLPGLDAESAKMVASLLQSFTLTRSGGHLSGAFDLSEPPQDQARDLGMLTALSVYGVRKYMLAAKADEARAAIAQIAKNYTGYLSENASKPGAKLKLISFPAVPKKIPSGAKYQSAPAEWKAWEPLRFAFTGPQYYQYEVRAAKDGKSADIIARGDLNGDGKSSEFRLHLALDKDKLTIGPDLEEHDAAE